jgi:hypothetical protein
MEEYRTKAEALKALQAKVKKGLKGWRVRRKVTYVVEHRLFG